MLGSSLTSLGQSARGRARVARHAAREVAIACAFVPRPSRGVPTARVDFQRTVRRTQRRHSRIRKLFFNNHLRVAADRCLSSDSYAATDTRSTPATTICRFVHVAPRRAVSRGRHFARQRFIIALTRRRAQRRHRRRRVADVRSRAALAMRRARRAAIIEPYRAHRRRRNIARDRDTKNFFLRMRQVCQKIARDNILFETTVQSSRSIASTIAHNAPSCWLAIHRVMNFALLRKRLPCFSRLARFTRHAECHWLCQCLCASDCRVPLAMPVLACATDCRVPLAMPVLACATDRRVPLAMPVLACATDRKRAGKAGVTRTNALAEPVAPVETHW